MRKFVSMVLVALLIISCCACGSGSEDNAVKVGLVCLHDENSPYDNNFIRAFTAACDVKGVDYLIKTNVGETSDCFNAASELADDGCNIVFADSFGHEGYMMQAAQEFPDVQFCHATGTQAHTAGLANYHNAFASIYEGRYIDGVVLGMKLNEMIENGDITADEALVGYVGAFQYAEVISGYTAFFLGVRSVCSEATMKVIFTGSWYDETLEREAANLLIEQGCVAISGHADSMGIPNACEAAGVPFVFYNDNVVEVAPHTFMVATRINWQPYFEYIIDCVQNGEAIATDWTGTVATGSVEMTNINIAVAPDSAEAAVANLIEQFTKGEIHVFDVTTFTVNGSTLDSYLADVNSDENYTPDTEVVSDGYFHESEYRSAPYFDISIDLIEIP